MELAFVAVPLFALPQIRPCPSGLQERTLSSGLLQKHCSIGLISGVLRPGGQVYTHTRVLGTTRAQSVTLRQVFASEYDVNIITAS